MICRPLRNAAQMPRRFAPGTKKPGAIRPGRDTHSYDDGLNTQDSVTRVNSFFAFVSHTEHALICNIVRMER
jgi:hypothetical protein